MTTLEIQHLIEEQFGSEAVIESKSDLPQPFLVLHPLYLTEVCAFLRNTKGLYFDYLSSLSGVDFGPSENKMAVVYHLYSLTEGHSLVIKCIINRSEEASHHTQVQPEQTSEEDYPEVPSVRDIWRAADWHEREVFDLLGIRFVGHAELRRILLPEDWQGYPLRKDYATQESYHHIKVDYY